jgi:hypothetical protein
VFSSEERFGRSAGSRLRQIGGVGRFIQFVEHDLSPHILAPLIDGVSELSSQTGTALGIIRSNSETAKSGKTFRQLDLTKQ